jgi:hypothetical protein
MQKGRNTAGIDPHAIYPLATFREITRLGSSSTRKARAAGLPLPTFVVGRVHFVEGAAAIDWLKAVAAMQSNEGGVD